MSSVKRITDTDRFVGQSVRARRLALGISQDKLAGAIGVTFQQVQKYEKGTNRVGAGRLAEIATVLQCEIADLYPSKGAAPVDHIGAGIASFMAKVEGVRLMKAMILIENDAIRSRLVALVEAVAKTHGVTLQAGAASNDRPQVSEGGRRL